MRAESVAHLFKCAPEVCHTFGPHEGRKCSTLLSVHYTCATLSALMRAKSVAHLI